MSEVSVVAFVDIVSLARASLRQVHRVVERLLLQEQRLLLLLLERRKALRLGVAWIAFRLGNDLMTLTLSIDWMLTTTHPLPCQRPSGRQEAGKTENAELCKEINVVRGMTR